MNHRALLRIATYNIHKCSGLDLRTSPVRIARVLRELDADILCLQEVVDAPHTAVWNQAAFLTDTLPGYTPAFGFNRELHGGGYGNLTLTRLPLIQSQNHDITDRREPRGALQTDIAITPALTAHVFNVHLGTGHFERRRQAARMLSPAVLAQPHLSGPRIVLGDFNEWTRGLATRLLTREFATFRPRHAFKFPRTFPGLVPVLTLDHCYYDAPLDCRKVSSGGPLPLSSRRIIFPSSPPSASPEMSSGRVDAIASKKQPRGKNTRMSTFQDVIQKNSSTILSQWIGEMASTTRRSDLMSDATLKRQAAELLRLFTETLQSGRADEAMANARDYLKEIARSRMSDGFSAAATALFVLSLKQPIIESLRADHKSDPAELTNNIISIGLQLDKLALYTVDFAIEFRDQVITRQQEEMLELSTPVVKLWDGILALPLIGTLDSSRTQVVMESLLSAVVETNSRIAIIDITGVPTVDTLVAQHLIKTITAARLMGADCYLSGIRPAIAQTIVHLGIDLTAVTTKARLSDAFALALSTLGKTVVNSKALKSQGDAAVNNLSETKEL